MPADISAPAHNHQDCDRGHDDHDDDHEEDHGHNDKHDDVIVPVCALLGETPTRRGCRIRKPATMELL